jgi:hypothetical protein
MSGTLLVPFNFQPVSSSTTLGDNYTVPSGKYAFVQYEICAGRLTLNGSYFDNSPYNGATTYTGTSTPSSSTILQTGTSTSVATTELTLITASVEGVLELTLTNPDSVASTFTYRHTRSGSTLSTWVFPATTTSASFKGLIAVKSGDLITVQSGSASAASRTATLGLMAGVERKTGSLWLKAGDVLAHSSYLAGTKHCKFIVTEYNTIT